MSKTIHGILFGLGAGAFWGLSFLIPKSFGELTPGVLALARCSGFAIMSFAVLLRVRALGKIRDRHWRMALWLSITGYSVYYYLLIFSIRFAGISVSSLIIGLLPITISLASRDVVQRKNIFRLSIAMIGAGILLLNVDGLSALTASSGDKGQFVLGVILSAVSLVTWTAFSVQNSRYLKANPDIVSGHWAAVVGVYSLLTMLPLAALDLCIGSCPIVDGTFIKHVIIATIVLGFGCSYVASLMWNIASKTLPTGLTGQLIVSETVFALLYGYIYDGAWPTPLEALCIVLLIGGVVLGVRAFLAKKST